MALTSKLVDLHKEHKEQYLEEKMNNKEIIDEIRSHLTKEKDIDIAYLQTELEIYKNE